MVVSLPLLLCLLLGCVWCGPEPAHGAYLDQQISSDITPDQAGLSDLRVAGAATPEQVVAALADLLQSSVREATASSYAELTSRLDGVQHSLAALTQLAARMDTVEKTLTGIKQTITSVSSHQESLQQTITAASSQQDSLQKTLSHVSSSKDDVQEALAAISGQQDNATDGIAALTRRLVVLSGRQRDAQQILDSLPSRQQVQQVITAHCSRNDGVTDTLATLSSTQKAVQAALSAQNSKLDSLTVSLASLSDRQQDVQRVLDVLPTREYIQQTLAVLSSRLDWTETLATLTERQQDVQQTLSSHSTRLDGVKQSLVAVSDRQQEARQTLSSLSSQMDGVKKVLFAFSSRQQAVQETLSTHSSQLVSMTEALSSAPLPAGRPGLITGQVLGGPCRSDQDCSALRADTVCGSQGQCECGEGLQRVAGEVCRPFPRLTDECRATSDCRGSTEYAVCSDGECSCPLGLSNFNNVECRSGLGIGEPCVYDTDCSTLLGLTCNSGACAVRTCDTASTAKYRYRLVGGSSCANGYVQFTFNAGQLWQYVCDSNWTEEDAAVACRYMGFRSGSLKTGNNTAVDATNFFSVEDYVCSGSERSLSACRRTYGRSGCVSSEVAGVECRAE